MIKLIVAVDENWAIGYQNNLLYHIKEDLKRFKNLTTGHIIVMGRKTLESMTKSAPLPNRTNVVLSSHYLPDTVVACHDMNQLREYLQNNEDDDIFIIGGDSVYRKLIDYCTIAEVTKIYAKKSAADAYFPNLDKLANWQITDSSEIYHEGELTYSFVQYTNENPKSLGELK